MNLYQTLDKRIIAFLIDSIVFAPLGIFYALAGGMGLPEWAYIAMTPLGSVAGIGYNVLLHWKYGQTLGKMVAKVKVLDLSEKPITFGQSCRRDIAYILSEAIDIAAIIYLLVLGFSWGSDPLVSAQEYLSIPLLIWFLVDAIVCIKSKKNRALHDFIAGTVVVRLDVLSENECGKNLDPPAPDAYARLRSHTG